jgi:hypothetical protein
MKIGKLTLETVAPNAERLISSTGLSIAEMRSMLAGSVALTFSRVPSTLVSRRRWASPSLAQAIAEHGIEAVRAEARFKLYVPKKEPKRVSKSREERLTFWVNFRSSLDGDGIHASAVAAGDLEYRARAGQGPDADRGAVRFARTFRRGTRVSALPS